MSVKVTCQTPAFSLMAFPYCQAIGEIYRGTYGSARGGCSAYTDGISEAMTAGDEEWGETRVLKAVTRATNASAAEVLEKVFHAADEFTAGAEQHDDMTLLVMKIMKAAGVAH